MLWSERRLELYSGTKGARRRRLRRDTLRLRVHCNVSTVRSIHATEY